MDHWLRWHVSTGSVMSVVWFCLGFESQLSYFSIGVANDDDEEEAREQRRRAREERKKMREAELAGTTEVIDTNRYGV